MDPALETAVLKQAENGEMACAVAFDLAVALGVEAGEIGVAMDLKNLRITQCQLGLFGYHPKKKITTPADSVSNDLEQALRGGTVDDRLPCKTAWTIAHRFKLPKLAVGRACETLGIKIKPCQLGAF